MPPIYTRACGHCSRYNGWYVCVCRAADKTRPGCKMDSPPAAGRSATSETPYSGQLAPRGLVGHVWSELYTERTELSAIRQAGAPARPWPSHSPFGRSLQSRTAAIAPIYFALLVQLQKLERRLPTASGESGTGSGSVEPPRSCANTHSGSSSSPLQGAPSSDAAMRITRAAHHKELH